MKLASAIMLAAAGLGVFHLVNKDVGEVAERFVSRLHLDPDNRLIQPLISQISGLDRKRLEAIGAGTLFYAVLHAIEGIGLLMRRNWAGYLTVILTGSLLPLELYEVARKTTAVRVAVLLTNLVILIYLVVRLIQERRATADQGVESASRA
jgi:uncharacterized membrane protein (DUF2068 family)